MNTTDQQIATAHLEKAADSLYQLADRLAALATGSLALTVTFRKDLAASSSQDLWMLKTSWVGFVVTVIGFVLIYHGRIAVHQRMVECAINSRRPLTASPPCYFRIGRFLLLLGFCVGLAFLAFYGLKH